MEDSIRSAIEHQAKKLLERDKKERYAAVKFERRYALRTGEDAVPGQHRSPRHWDVGNHFNPVYCIRHSKFLAKVLWRKLLAREYVVEPAILHKIPKDGGGHREIMVFSILDSAIANLFNRKLRDRNRNILSSFCYSYRKDRGIFDAVLQLSSLLKSEKAYIVQFDFAKYFDSIKHDYIKFILERNFFVISPTEEFVIDRFLGHRFAELTKYREEEYERRTVGTPQGCSLSLFLSNIAAHELDKKLERTNGTFVRFADDIVCVTYNHDDALNVVQHFRQHCHYSGISINYEKSPGIAQLKSPSVGDSRFAFVNEGDVGRVKRIAEFDYIGHKFTNADIKISSKGIARIKRRISKLVYIHLLHNPRSRKKFSRKRVGRGFYDWDFVTCINEIRRYINGGLKERELKGFLDRNIRIRKFKGLMSFYPLVTSIDQFSKLDGWLVSILRRALKERYRVLRRDFRISRTPLTNAEIISGSWYTFQSQVDLETNAPSFVLAWRAARKSFKQYGLIDFEQPSYYSATMFTEYD
jgi:RNA-directed DNA polymerase